MATSVDVVIADITHYPTPALVVNLFQGVTHPGGGTGAIDNALGGGISGLIADGEITGKVGEMTLIHTMGKIPAARVLVAGLGKSENLDADQVRRISGSVARFLRGKGVSDYATIAHGAGIGGLDANDSGRAVTEGTLLGLYKFDQYRSNGNDVTPDEMLGNADGSIHNVTIVEIDEDRANTLRRGVATGQVLAEATMLARDLVNHPANVMTPTRMADAAHGVAEATGAGI